MEQPSSGMSDTLSNIGRRGVLAVVGAATLCATTASAQVFEAAPAPEIANIRMFGASGNGVTNDDAARAAGEAASRSLYWPEGTYIVNQVPSLAVSWGPGQPIVNGTRVYLRPDPRPAAAIFVSVFNLASGNGTDVSQALQTLVDFAQEKNLPVVFPPGADYLLNTGLVCKHGRSATDSQSYSVRIHGNNCTLRPGPNQTVLSVLPRCLLSDSTTGRGVASIEITDLVIDGYYAPSSGAALSIGVPGYWCDSFIWSKIDNIEVQSFTAGTVMTVQDARHIRWSRVVCRTGTFSLLETVAGGFCGDFVFDTCEFSGSAEWRPLNLSVGQSASGSLAQLRGIHFKDCNIYGSGTLLGAALYSQLGDIWFQSCAWDGPGAPTGQSAIQVLCTGNAQVFQLHLTDPYVVSYTGAAVVIQQQDSSNISNSRMSGACFNTIAPSGSGDFNSVILLQGASQFELVETLFSGIIGQSGEGASLFYCDNCADILIESTEATGCSNVSYGISAGGVATKNCLFSNNQMNVATPVNIYTVGLSNINQSNNVAI